MKIFEDLSFIQENCTRKDSNYKAIMRFDNGYGVSVLHGPDALSAPERPYELAVLKFNADGGYNLIFPTLFNEDVIPCLTSDEVTSYMKIIQALPELF